MTARSFDSYPTSYWFSQASLQRLLPLRIRKCWCTPWVLCLALFYFCLLSLGHLIRTNGSQRHFAGSWFLNMQPHSRTFSHTPTDLSKILKTPIQNHPRPNLFSYAEHDTKSCLLHFSINSNPFFLLQLPLSLSSGHLPGTTARVSISNLNSLLCLSPF